MSGELVRKKTLDYQLKAVTHPLEQRAIARTVYVDGEELQHLEMPAGPWTQGLMDHVNA